MLVLVELLPGKWEVNLGEERKDQTLGATSRSFACFSGVEFY